MSIISSHARDKTRQGYVVHKAEIIDNPRDRAANWYFDRAYNFNSRRPHGEVPGYLAIGVLQFSINLRADEDDQAAKPEPQEEDNRRGERPISLVVSPKARHVKGEKAGGDQPQEGCDRRS
jgi:hypothetical protein